jgi:hypothetical protein
MSEDASLDDFLDSGGGSADDGSEPTGESQTVADSTPEPSAQVDDEHEGDGGRSTANGGDERARVTPATTTYAWSDEGTTCEECAEPAERRWQQDGALVCPDCKVW